MKIVEIKALALPEIRVLKLQRFTDNRGYFMEAFRSDVMSSTPELPELKDKSLSQINESSSIQNVIRGLHTQYHPNLDKLLRVLHGKIIDVAVDIRLNSPTFGQAVAYELGYDAKAEAEELIFIPFGFAHGFIVLEEAHVQYFQTGFWNPEGEAIITYFDPAIDWSHCEAGLATQIQESLKKSIVADKDKNGLTLENWKTHPLSQHYHI